MAVAVAVTGGAFAGYFTDVDSTLWLMIAGLVGVLAWSSIKYIAIKFVTMGFSAATICASAAITSSGHWVYLITGFMLTIGYGVMIMGSSGKHLDDSEKAVLS